jgi:hypothetical protein
VTDAQQGPKVIILVDDGDKVAMMTNGYEDNIDIMTDLGQALFTAGRSIGIETRVIMAGQEMPDFTTEE